MSGRGKGGNGRKLSSDHHTDNDVPELEFSDLEEDDDNGIKIGELKMEWEYAAGMQLEDFFVMTPPLGENAEAMESDSEESKTSFNRSGHRREQARGLSYRNRTNKYRNNPSVNPELMQQVEDLLAEADKIYIERQSYPCPIPSNYKACSNITKNRAFLRYHLHVHLGIKPYMCPDCKAIFANPSGIYHHKKKRHMK